MQSLDFKDCLLSCYQVENSDWESYLFLSDIIHLLPQYLYQHFHSCHHFILFYCMHPFQILILILFSVKRFWSNVHFVKLCINKPSRIDFIKIPHSLSDCITYIQYAPCLSPHYWWHVGTYLIIISRRIQDLWTLSCSWRSATETAHVIERRW